MKHIQAIAVSLILGAASPAGHAADKATVLVTGANRGIGLEYARQFADKGYRVIGTAREPGKATELAAIADRVEALDVSDGASVAALATRLDGEPIDILVNNAGVVDRGDVSIDKVDFAQMEQTESEIVLGIDGVPFGEADPVPASVGETQLWTVRNTMAWAHPFHLHGFFFQVVGEAGAPVPPLEWRDTVDIPVDSAARFVVRYDPRPGMWMFHCHILDHADLGMMGMINVEK